MAEPNLHLPDCWRSCFDSAVAAADLWRRTWVFIAIFLCIEVLICLVPALRDNACVSTAVLTGFTWTIAMTGEKLYRLQILGSSHSP
jgi:hypothetical protein